MLEGVPNEQDLVDRLEEALDQLGTECQKLIRTYYYEGFQLKEIADKLDLSLGTIKMQKYRCLLRLAALLGIK